MTVIRKKRKNPTTALVLSGILPGLGQFYNGQIIKGILFLALVAVICVLAYSPVIYLINSWSSILDMSLDMSQVYKLLIYLLVANVILAVAMLDAKYSADRINAANYEE
jgi:arabinogalactan oligomer/maltooligosaccharide transport system permease protein